MEDRLEDERAGEHCREEWGGWEVKEVLNVGEGSGIKNGY